MIIKDYKRIKEERKVAADIKEAINIVLNCYSDEGNFGMHSKLYGFTNEDSQDQPWDIDYKDKDILSICASGDHPLNALLWGASVARPLCRRAPVQLEPVSLPSSRRIILALGWLLISSWLCVAIIMVVP